MEFSGSLSECFNEYAVPVPIQIFLWQQSSPFTRPKLGKHHEATCTICQTAPGHHELKEACKVLEKVLVQNLHFRLDKSLTDAIRSITRWRLIQASFPYIVHCTASTLHNRKDMNLQNLGAVETKLLYILHWIILDAATECAEEDYEKDNFHSSPYYYTFSIPALTLFMYLFAPLCHQIKESDLQSFRLENGLKIWQALWNYRHPDAPCFTTRCKPRPRSLWGKNFRSSQTQCGDVFLGRKESQDEAHPESPHSACPSISFFDQQQPGSGVLKQDDESNWVSSPKETVFPETIPEESSSTEEEHMVIFRLPSLAESDEREPATIFSADASIFQMPVNRNAVLHKPSLSIDPGTQSGLSDSHQQSSKTPVQGMGSSTDKDSVGSLKDGPNKKGFPVDSTHPDFFSATFMDVAVLRCLFISQWSEEGIFWALQFLYHRLQELSEEMIHQTQPRRRSNSLPIPKIEISLYQSPETMKKELKDFIEVPEPKDASVLLAELPYTGRKHGGDTPLKHFRRASEKAKRKMKITDFRLFVETALLSKSEKNLEKLGKEDQTESFKQDLHRSFDAEDSHIKKPASSLAKLLDPTNDASSMMPSTNLVKGKSMPSLSCILDELQNESGIGENVKELTIVANPIITVTEHTPIPSPDFFKMKGSMDSQLDEPYNHGKQGELTHESKHGSLTRSQTDSNITYSPEDMVEAPGSSCYITKDGDIDLQVVLKAIHSVALRENVSCTIRVCEMILNLIELLIEMGALKQCLRDEILTDKSGDNNTSESEEPKKSSKNPQNKLNSPHSLMLHSVIRVIRYGGCQNSCNDGQRSPPPDYIRSHGHSLLSKLRRTSSRQFSRFMKHMVLKEPLHDVIEFFHSYVSFCSDSNSLLSPLHQKRTWCKSPDMATQGIYATNFNANVGNARNKGLEGQIIACVFKTLVTRLMKSSKEMKLPEHVALFSDIRALIMYIKETHGGTFKRVVLSALLDTAVRPRRKEPAVQTTRVVRHIPSSELNEQQPNAAPCYVMDEKEARKILFKKRSTSSTCASLLETELNEESGGKVQSPLGNFRKKHHHILTPRQSERNLGDTDFSYSKQSMRLHKGGLVSWFRRKYGRSESMDSYEGSESPGESALAHQAASLHHSYSKSSQKSVASVGHTFHKAKVRMEHQLNKFGFGKGKKKDGSVEETPGSYLSRRNSTEYGDQSRESEIVVLKERRLVQQEPLLRGVQRLSFLLETCLPGSTPDPHLIAAVLDLPNTAVVARAAFLLECSYFVHCCNKGQWPQWMKFNFPMFRPSGPFINRGSTVPIGVRRSQNLQRAAGKMFYLWGEAISAKLEEMLLEDKQHITEIVTMLCDENKQKQLLIEDEEEDFLDESTVNLYGSDCPIALRLLACTLLLEITAFLRETYQNLPKLTCVCSKDRPPPWDKIFCRDPNRRWSMALSSMGQSQTSAQSLQSIVGDNKEAGMQAERKISFVLHEPENESEGDNNHWTDDKKGRRPTTTTSRPYLLRRGTAGAPTGSFKRRSLKLRRNTKEGKDMMECDFKRADSIQSKRKVSSISDRSDFSEQGVEASGEESPGVLSDEIPPASPSDSNDTDETCSNLPWMKIVAQIINSFNFFCSHQNFCHPLCHRRHMRACTRLVKAVRRVYGEDFGIPEKIKEAVAEETKKDVKGRNRKVSEQASSQTSPVRRKDSICKKDRIDRNMDNSLGKGSTKDIADSTIFHEKHKRSEEKTEAEEEKSKELPNIVKYIKTQVKDAFHLALAVMIKGGVVLAEDLLIEVLPAAWELLLEPNQEVAACAATFIIIASIRVPNPVAELLQQNLNHQDPAVRISSLLRYQILWSQRYLAVNRMEEGAHLTLRVPPPSIEFTLPSPKIGIESLPVVDSPWEPLVKSKVEDVTIGQDSHRSLVTATKTRKKQQTDMIKLALLQRENQERNERETFLITTIPILTQAANEQRSHHNAGDDHDEGEEDPMETQTRSHHTQVSHAFFPSSLCTAAVYIIGLLDDAAVSQDGVAVYEITYEVIWNCLVDDCGLFLRYILERLTRERSELEAMFKILRHLIRFVPKLPQQAAFSLYNYIIGYVMYYVRSPHEDGQKMIGAALSVLWMVVHSVQGIMFKDLKQILRKEQCDASILLTANVPSTKKIIVHGAHEQDGGGIPSQFPVQEDTQFCQILRESLDFFGIEEAQHKEYFLVDLKSHQIHNPASYVRDFYFFKRSQYPQLELVHMKTDEAFNALQRQELYRKFVEIGKVLLTWAILKNVDMVVQRVVFLHEELMKLPSFPRKALETDLDLCKGGEMGKELLGLDVLHKFMWVRLIARMFEAMAGNFAYSGDIHLFLNVLNGALALHSEDAIILRYVCATYINAAHNFKNIFSTNGYLLIIPALLQLYSSHQTNKLVTRTVEYTIKQFYLMNRKPFILQMFGSVSAILDIDETAEFGESHKVQSSCLFTLLLSLETPSPDPLNIGELVREEQPLKAIDFCYHDESEMVTVLDCISLCVMVVAYAADSQRSHQMLIILEAILPCYLRQIQLPSYRKEGKTEREIISQLAVAIQTLVNNCEALSKNYNGPQRSSPEHKGSSQRNFSRGPYSPGFEYDDDSHSKYLNERSRTKLMNYERDIEDYEVLRNEFRRPRDVLLSLVADFVTKSTSRLTELNKKYPQDGKTVELLDFRSHIRLADVAHSLLKVSPYDPDTMGCKGLQRYMTQLLPSTDWSVDQMRPALMLILRRLDKTFLKIYKKYSIRRHTDWEAASGLLKGLYETLSRHPYIVHLQPLKSIVNTCQGLIVGDSLSTGGGENLSSASAALMSQAPPPYFCKIVVSLIALQILCVGIFNHLTPENYTLEHVCGGSSVFPSQDRTENMLMNFLMPLCLHIGVGRKDVQVQSMRQADISFTLTVVLHALMPPTTKTCPVTAQNIKTASEMRTGSLTFIGRDSKQNAVVPKHLYEVSFLALKMMVVCFEPELVNDWPRIAKTIRDISKLQLPLDVREMFWKFIDFIVTQRCPLFILLLPFIHQRLLLKPFSEEERHLYTSIKEKLMGQLPPPKCRALLLTELFKEMKDLKEKLELQKQTSTINKEKTVQSSTSDMLLHQRHHRPSLIDFWPGSGSHIDQQTSHRESQSSTPESFAFSEKTKFSAGADALSPDDDNSNEVNGRTKSRLHRSKAQSGRTFRLRKSRIESNHSRASKEQNKDSNLDYMEASQDDPNDSYDPQQVRYQYSNQLQNGDSKMDYIKTPPVKIPHSQSSLVRCVSRNETSWDEDSILSQTSSTSGYRENCSLLMMAFESPPEFKTHFPHSVSSSTVVPPSPDSASPPLSVSGSTVHSLNIMMCDAQEEDTLI
ncbi:protein unc-80 homolog isoform X1 [Bemisia tabaci]|uniref:protein unc-80 homolog isoform X1 n=1 Tax=Bemisia tabaci TaxID=7038 RepID=UPI0008F99BED|nr:PREDICTED: protein unc-80 homolog isoform X1 [Bemisia tabaci]